MLLGEGFVVFESISMAAMPELAFLGRIEGKLVFVVGEASGAEGKTDGKLLTNLGGITGFGATDGEGGTERGIFGGVSISFKLSVECLFCRLMANGILVCLCEYSAICSSVYYTIISRYVHF